MNNIVSKILCAWETFSGVGTQEWKYSGRPRHWCRFRHIRGPDVRAQRHHPFDDSQPGWPIQRDDCHAGIVVPAPHRLATIAVLRQHTGHRALHAHPQQLDALRDAGVHPIRHPQSPAPRRHFLARPIFLRRGAAGVNIQTPVNEVRLQENQVGSGCQA